MMKKINEMRELQKKKGKKGFSMIELIIVIAIMAILVALIGTQLIPYLEKSREKRDMTTLDTCKTAFESAVAETEFPITKGKTYKVSDLTTDGQTLFQQYSGLKTGDTPFKSDASGGNTIAVTAVEFAYDSNGVLDTVSVGKLSVSSKGSTTTGNSGSGGTNNDASGN